MSLSELQYLLKPYEGPNWSHRKYRANSKYLNALYYLVVSGKGALLEHLRREYAGAASAAGPDQGFALGIVSDPVSPTQIAAITVSRADVQALLDDFDGFVQAVGKQCIVGVHRAFVDYTIDLLIELLEGELVSLPSDRERKIRERRASPRLAARTYDELGIPLSPVPDEARALQRLSMLRNAIEHNNGLATAEYVRACDEGTLRQGDVIPIGSREVGRALAIVDHVGRTLNERAVLKWPKLTAG